MSILIQYSLVFACVLTLVALGGMFAERSGVINLGLEGCMVMGALAGALVMRFTQDIIKSGFVLIVITILASVAAGMIFSLLLAVAAISFKADQTITGTAMNILSTALATVIVKTITMQLDGKASPYLYYIKAHDKFVFNIGSFELNWFIIITFIIVAIAVFVLYKTKFGLRLMSCGEFPQASASAGINVIRMRYIGVLISGALGGLGGIAYINSVNSSWPFDVGVAGMGFLALALMIFGRWKPLDIFIGSLVFGFFKALGYVYGSFPVLANLHLTSEIYNMLPYIICLVILIFTSKNSRAPKSEGIPYDPGMR